MGMGPLEKAVAAAVEGAPVAVVTTAATAAAGGSYALLQCGEDSAYVRDAYGGYFEVFRALLAEDGERWQVYRAVRGELPSDDEAAGIDGFVISGSCSDAHGDEPWILALVDLIRNHLAAGKRILGVCFGHQVRPSIPSLAFSFGSWLVGLPSASGPEGRMVIEAANWSWPALFFPCEIELVASAVGASLPPHRPHQLRGVAPF